MSLKEKLIECYTNNLRVLVPGTNKNHKLFVCDELFDLVFMCVDYSINRLSSYNSAYDCDANMMVIPNRYYADLIIKIVDKNIATTTIYTAHEPKNHWMEYIRQHFIKSKLEFTCCELFLRCVSDEVYVLDCDKYEKLQTMKQCADAISMLENLSDTKYKIHPIGKNSHTTLSFKQPQYPRLYSKSMCIYDRECDLITPMENSRTYGDNVVSDSDPIYQDCRWMDYADVPSYFIQKSKELIKFESSLQNMPIKYIRKMLPIHLAEKEALQYHTKQLSDLYKRLSMEKDNNSIGDMLYRGEDPIKIIRAMICKRKTWTQTDFDECCYRIIQNGGSKYLPLISSLRSHGLLDKTSPTTEKSTDTIIKSGQYDVIVFLGGVTNDEIMTLKKQMPGAIIIATSFTSGDKILERYNSFDNDKS